MATPGLIGRVTRLWTGECDPTPTMWIETGVEAALRAFYTFGEPDPKEAFHIATGRSVVCTLKQGINDVEDEAPALSSGGKRFLFKISELVDQAVWYAFVADVTGEALANWTSLAWKLAGCNMPLGSKGAGSTSPYGALDADGQWHVALPWYTSWGGPGPAISPDIVVHGDQSAYIACGISWKIKPGVSYPEMRIVDQLSGEVFDHTQADDDGSLDTKTAMLWSGLVAPNGRQRRLTCQARATTAEGPPDQVFPHTGYLTQYPKV